MELTKLPGYNELTSKHKKTAKALKMNVESFCKAFGLNNVGFLTLTFGTHGCSKCGTVGAGKCPKCGDTMKELPKDGTGPEDNVKEAERRYNSFLTNILRKKYGSIIRVLERGEKNGRIHFHLLVNVGFDIRTGFNFQSFDELLKGMKEGRIRRYSAEWKEAYSEKNVPACLKGEWEFLRKTAKVYGFGTPQLLPIRKNEEAVSKYVGGYISEHVRNRNKTDKGARLVSYTNPSSYRQVWSNFSYNTPGGWAFRMKIKTYCERYNVEYEKLCKDLAEKKGLKYFFEQIILPMSLHGTGLVYPTKKHAELCGEDVSGLPDGAQQISYISYIPKDQIEQEKQDIENSVLGTSPDWSVDPDFSEINTGQINPENQRKLKAWIWAEKFRDRIDGFKPEFIGYKKSRVIEARERWEKCKKEK